MKPRGCGGVSGGAMSHDSDLLEVVHRIERDTVERVVVMLEQCWPLDTISVHVDDDWKARLRRLRGLIHGCPPGQYNMRNFDAPQAERSKTTDSAASVPHVHVGRAETKERKGSAPRARQAKTRQ